MHHSKGFEERTTSNILQNSSQTTTPTNKIYIYETFEFNTHIPQYFEFFNCSVKVFSSSSIDPL